MNRKTLGPSKIGAAGPAGTPVLAMNCVINPVLSFRLPQTTLVFGLEISVVDAAVSCFE